MKSDQNNRKRVHQAALQLFVEKDGKELSVSELAKRAGVARGTIYNNQFSTETLFAEVATELTKEMTAYILEKIRDYQDPSERLGLGIKLYLKRAHDEPDWARFLIRFAMSDTTLREFFAGPVMEDIHKGIAMGVYKLTSEELPSALTVLGCATLGGMLLVREGTQTWAVASHSIIRLILRALGVPSETAENVLTNISDVGLHVRGS